jgi:integrase
LEPAKDPNNQDKVQTTPIREQAREWNSHAHRYGPNYVALLKERISDANRAEYIAYLTAKEAQGLKVSSITTVAYNLYKLDKMSMGAPWNDITPAELTEALLKFSRDHSPATVGTFAAAIKAFWAWRSGGVCPVPVRVALRRRALGRENHRQPISPEVFEKLLASARETNDVARRAFQVAFLWTLWDTGFRISELLSLRVESVTFRDDGVELALPPDAPDLKSGPRTIFAVECAPSLAAWVALHPQPVPNAPLWPAHRKPMTPMMRTSVDNFLARISVRAGVRPPHPHLFRHTRATRAARAGWNVYQMSRYFGWSGNSNMAANYVHLVLSDVEDRVKADLAPPNPAPQPASVPVAAAPPPPSVVAPDPTAIAAAIAAALAAVEAAKKR